MSDVLAITVPVGARYASVNHTGAGVHRFGKKSDAYKTLFASVKDAASQAMLLHGWTVARCECFVTIVRYVGDRRRHDAMNLGKCEFDALTAAGVWADDSLANPCMPMIRYDVAGEHRVTIVIVKLYEGVLLPAGNALRRSPGVEASRPRKAAQAGSTRFKPDFTVPPNYKPGDPIPAGHALLDGKLVTREFALEKVGTK